MDKIITNPITKSEIIDGLRELGVRSGMVLEVHASLSAFGFVVGGAQSVVDALLEVLGENGTLLMPLQMADNSEVSKWVNPPVEFSDIKKVRDNIPAYDKYASDTRFMGDIVDNFRRRPGVVISSHPSLSFVAKGRHAHQLCNHQSLHFPLSSESPNARLYELRGYCLLLGVGFDVCTAMHLAEYACDCRPIVVEGAAVSKNGTRVWKKYLDLDLNSNDFKLPGLALEKLGKIEKRKIGSCDAMLFSVNDAVDEATRYFENYSSYNYYR